MEQKSVITLGNVSESTDAETNNHSSMRSFNPPDFQNKDVATL
jgi:hypothetical protein